MNLLKIRSYYKWKEAFLIILLRKAKSVQIRKFRREKVIGADLEVIRETEQEENLESARYSFSGGVV